MHAAGRCTGPSRPRATLEVAEIIRRHGDAYRERHRLSREQRAAMRAIAICRTETLGGHRDVCPRCDYQKLSYNSCRNRHCPKCQALTQARWIEKHRARILPVPYVHVVFTLPAELRPLARLNRARVFDVLFATVAATLAQLARDPGRLGATIGFTAVLHTWTRALHFHPHLHCVVTAGGLALDESQWVRVPGRFLFPVRVLSRLFRGKLLAALRRADQREPFVLSGEALGDLLDRAARKEWVVYAKAPFRGAEHVYGYLGRYTHRVAISNPRLIGITDDTVTFHTRGTDREVVSPQEFIHRFLLHVLPPGFVKIRHYGLLAGSNHRRREVARRLLTGADAPSSAPPPESPAWQDLLRSLTGRDVRACPVCGSTLRFEPLPPTSAPNTARAPPARRPR